MVDWSSIVMDHVCPSLGCVMSTLMFAAPVRDLMQCVIDGSLGELNPIPWAIMTGNCFGWIIYAYFKPDFYILLSNLPGFLISLWLNVGAIKLQYLEQQRAQSNKDENALLLVPQEQVLSRVILVWSAIIVWVGWIMTPSLDPAQVVGYIVNVNLVFFYASPLQSIVHVMKSHSSDSIHVDSVIMNILNTSFWTIYGIAQHNIIIIIPNASGLLLGLAQGALCLFYPRRGESDDNDSDIEANETSRLKRYQTQVTSRMSSLTTYE